MALPLPTDQPSAPGKQPSAKPETWHIADVRPSARGFLLSLQRVIIAHLGLWETLPSQERVDVILKERLTAFLCSPCLRHQTPFLMSFLLADLVLRFLLVAGFGGTRAV